MKRSAITIFALCLSLTAFSQEKSAPPSSAKPPDFALTEVQKLKLENLQLKAKLKQKEVMEAQQQFQGSLTELLSAANEIKSKNNWPENTEFSVDSLSFYAPPPPPPTPKPETKKPETKK